MRDWCKANGVMVETSVPHSAYQNGRAERLGGVVWQGGASLRYGGNLPNEDWLACCLAFIHQRNRLPSTSCKHPARTPFAALECLDLSIREQVDHFRVIGCLCYRIVPLNTRVGKPKRSERCVMMGYSDEGGQKGYYLRSLETGEVKAAALNQVEFCESKLVFPPSPSYDAWLRKEKSYVDGKEESEEEDSEDDENDDLTDGESEEEESDTDDSDSDGSYEPLPPAVAVGDGAGDENDDVMLMERLARGEALTEERQHNTRSSTQQGGAGASITPNSTQTGGSAGAMQRERRRQRRRA